MLNIIIMSSINKFICLVCNQKHLTEYCPYAKDLPCTSCKRVHHADPCAICEKRGHIPRDCNEKCHCMIFEMGCFLNPHNKENHCCSICNDKHLEELCPFICQCGELHRANNHICSICHRKHYVESCAICNITGHIPFDCPEKCSCIGSVTLIRKKWKEECIRISDVHSSQMHKCHYCHQKHSEKECHELCWCGGHNKKEKHDENNCFYCGPMRGLMSNPFTCKHIENNNDVHQKEYNDFLAIGSLL